MKRVLLFVYLLILIPCIQTWGQINVDYYMDKGKENLEKNKFLDAIEYFNTIIRFKPDQNDAWYLRGAAKYFLGDDRGAIEDLSVAIKENPYPSDLFTRYFLFRGLARKHLMDLKGALEDFSQAIEVNPGNYDAYKNRGLIFIALNEPAKALEDLNTVILYDRKNSEAYLYRAIAYYERGDSISSSADFDRAIRLNPKDPETFLRRALIRIEQKNYKEAVKDLNVALRLDSTNTLGYFKRAMCKSEMNDIQGAIRDYSKVIQLDPNNDISYFNRAILKEKTGDTREAIEDYSQVVALNPSNILPYFNRGNLWIKLNNPRKAIEDYSVTIKLYPEFSNAYYNRSIARKMIKDLQGAERDFMISRNLNANYQNMQNSMKLDSTGLAKLQEFKASFDPDNRINDTEETAPVSNFMISYQVSDSVRMSESYYKLDPHTRSKVNDLNQGSGLKGTFFLTTKDSTISQDQINHWYEDISKSKAADSPSKIFALAILKKKLQDYNGSIANYTQLIHANPQLSVAYFNRATTRLEALSLLNSFTENSSSYMGQSYTAPVVKKTITINYNEVISDYQKSIDLDPQFCYGYFDLAKVKTLQKDYMGAIINYTKAILINPKFAEAYYNRGLLYLYLQQNEGGCADMSKAGEFGLQKAYDAIKTFCNK